jgi:predicted transcriptional regulator
VDDRFLAGYRLTVANGLVRPPLLGELEHLVMNHLWSGGDGEAKDVHAKLGKRRGITLNTVQSTLKRLFEKGLLARDKVSHAHVYRPLMTREDFHRSVLHEIVGGMMQEGAEAMVSAFVDLADRAGPETLTRLEQLVAQRRREQTKARR